MTLHFAKRKIVRFSIWLVAVGFVFANVLAIIHSYRFTHFEEPALGKKINNNASSVALKSLFTGVQNPPPVSSKMPAVPFETVVLQSNRKIECWYIKQANAIGTIILFHSYAAEKSSLLDHEQIFQQFGYNTLLVDFMGSGNSEGNQTTIGFKETTQVRTAFEFVQKQGEQTIYLFGVSMGAVAIMKALADDPMQVNGIIIECPFGTMYQTVQARFRLMKLPSFPFASMIVFWGGVQNGFWAFGHNPVAYASKINCPTLLLYGAKDNRVSREETQAIFTNLAGEKFLKIYHEAGHERYLLRYRDVWKDDVHQFLNRKSNQH
ncbi:MAG: prolyl oligopeptidase family serine peptidase [Cyclobacteriaceae bacterium]|nr:prolyl oligopeptidase family serine peptidase [Cyclobacteriaceae bacterium]